MSPALATLRRLMTAVAAALFAVVGVLLPLLLPQPGWMPVVLGLSALLGAAVAWVLIGRSARRWAYAEREEDLYIRRGALFRRLVVVPTAGCSTSTCTPARSTGRSGSPPHLHTASPETIARIPGLPAAEAVRLRDRLTSLGEAQAAGL